MSAATRRATGSLRLSVVVDPERRQIATALLWSGEPRGVEIQPHAAGHELFWAYFDPEVEDEARRVVSALQGRGLESRLEPFEDQDWMVGYRRASRPLALGRGFWVDPRSADSASDLPGSTVPSPEDRRRLHIPAQQAFGTGSHETTQLAVELLEGLAPLDGQCVLDVGSGSGILSFVAQCLGASRVVGFDVEIESIFVARENAHRNGFSTPRGVQPVADPLSSRPPSGPAFHAGPVSSIGETSFDVVVANVLPDNLAADMDEVAARVVEGGALLVSGVLEQDRTRWLERWLALGFELVETRVRGEWVGFHLQRSCGERAAT